MSRSQKWKLEWAFFLDADGRRKYNDVCRRCVHDCKQTVVIVRCPRYTAHQSRQIGRYLCREKGGKQGFCL